MTRASRDSWIEITPARGWFATVDAGELWTHRDVVRVLAMRKLKSRYKQAVLGASWAVLQPLVGVVLFTLVFDRLAGVPSDGLPYPVFALAGLAIWTYFSNSVAAATESLVEDSALITKIYFPRLLAPAASVAAPLIDLGVILCVLAVAAVAFGTLPGIEAILLPVWVLAAIGAAYAAGLIFSALNVRYRDIGQALTFILQTWLFASPVVFPSSAVEGLGRVLLALNPMTGVIDGFRWSALGAPAPPPVDLLSLLTGTLMLFGGVAYFQAAQRRFADVV